MFMHSIISFLTLHGNELNSRFPRVGTEDAVTSIWSSADLVSPRY